MHKPIVYILAALLAAASAGTGFAEDKNAVAKFYFFHRLNTARTAPQKAIAGTGVDPSKVKSFPGQPFWDPDTGVEPVAWNNALYTAAAGHLEDMVSRLYYSSTGPDGKTEADRIRSRGYDFVKTGEALGIVAFDKYIGPFEAVDILFSRLLKEEILSHTPGDRTFLHHEFREAGIAFEAKVVDTGGKAPLNLYLLVADFAEPVQERSFVTGVYYSDTDLDGWFDPGEELSGVDIVLENFSFGTAASMQTTPLGGFQFVQDPGIMLLKSKGGAGADKAVRNLFGSGKNRYIQLEKEDRLFY